MSIFKWSFFFSSTTSVDKLYALWEAVPLSRDAPVGCGRPHLAFAFCPSRQAERGVIESDRKGAAILRGMKSVRDLPDW